MTCVFICTSYPVVQTLGVENPRKRIMEYFCWLDGLDSALAFWDSAKKHKKKAVK